MRNWKYENGIEVKEINYDYDLHALEVYHGETYLGNIYPSTVQDMENCINLLDNGEDPITGCWEDGCGNCCTLDGWAI